MCPLEGSTRTHRRGSREKNPFWKVNKHINLPVPDFDGGVIAFSKMWSKYYRIKAVFLLQYIHFRKSFSFFSLLKKGSKSTAACKNVQKWI